MKNITKIIIIISIITVFTIVVQSYPADVYDPNEIDSDVILPDGIPTDFFLKPIEIEPEPEPLTPLESLKVFLANDTTDRHPSIQGVYDCKDYSIDLAYNLTAAGYDAGCMITVPKWHHLHGGHSLTSVVLSDIVYVVEPQNDGVCTYDEFRNNTNLDDYVVRLVTISIAESQRTGMRQWGVE